MMKSWGPGVQESSFPKGPPGSGVVGLFFYKVEPLEKQSDPVPEGSRAASVRLIRCGAGTRPFPWLEIQMQPGSLIQPFPYRAGVNPANTRRL